MYSPITPKKTSCVPPNTETAIKTVGMPRVLLTSPKICKNKVVKAKRKPAIAIATPNKMANRAGVRVVLTKPFIP